MGETRVDLLHLLEDLADAYPGALDETVLTEIVANSLDSGASVIAVTCDPSASALTVTDDGGGMTRAELRRFHDVAASTKSRGEGIGFAGVGIKLGLLVSAEVVTESRRGRDHIATTWALAQRKRAPWHWIPPAGLVGERGTAVRLRLENPLSPLLDTGFVETVLRRHFEPLFDPYFDDVLREHYPSGVRFEINGAAIERHHAVIGDGEEAAVAVRLARKRTPSAVGYLCRAPRPLPEGQRGLAVSTFGKVIKRGWDWLGVNPVAGDCIGGLVEVPALAATLTLNKIDFIRFGPRGATYMTYRKALQQVLGDQLAAWGDAGADHEHARRRAARPVERDMEQVLVDLSADFPMLAMLVERRGGGERKLPVGDRLRSAAPMATDLFAPADELQVGTPPEPPEGSTADEHVPDGGGPDQESTRSTDSPPAAPPAVELPSKAGRRKPGRLGLTIQFESQPDHPELGRLVETTVWVNDAHPAYRRAEASRSEGYHIALSVALALASIAVEPGEASRFVSEFLARWGESATSNQSRRSGRRQGVGRRKG